MVALHMQLLVILKPLTFQVSVGKFFSAYLVNLPEYSSSFGAFCLLA